ncbi:hypothetical protein [Mesorhizobium australicum]|uniref:hypothetical protein n=1 Tax=Mesorhizobium australicum TaxID=536018 RepID=UPI003336312D
MAEARAAMNGEWKNKNLHSYRQALRLLEEARQELAGNPSRSRPLAARDQDMIVSDQPSEALKRLDVLARCIYAQDRQLPRSV